jgi:hypothetical protein
MAFQPEKQGALFLALEVFHLFQVFIEPLEPGFDGDHVGQEKLLLHGPDIAGRIDSVLRVGEGVVGETANDVEQDVGFTQGVEKGARFYFTERNSGQVENVDGDWDPLPVGGEGRQGVQPGIGKRADPFVGFPLTDFESVHFGPGTGQDIK